MWVDINKELPKRGVLVDLTNGKKRFTDFIYLSSIEKFRSKSTKIDHNPSKFTHWMKVPDLPQK